MDILNLNFNFKTEDTNETVGFMGLCELCDGYLDYDGETDQIIFGTDENTREYTYQMNNTTTIENLQIFFNAVLTREELNDVMTITVQE